MDYQVLIAPLAFGFAMQIAAKYDAKPKLSAFVAVGIPFIVTTVITTFRAIGFHYPIIGNVLSLSSIMILVIQYIAALFIFDRLQYEDGFGGFLLWGVGGFTVIAIFIPALIGTIIH